MQLLDELKAMKKNHSVLIISAKDSVEDKVLGLEKGADDYLAKPFHLAELLARVIYLSFSGFEFFAEVFYLRIDKIEAVYLVYIVTPHSFSECHFLHQSIRANHKVV